jgi:hypothetical protein
MKTKYLQQVPSTYGLVFSMPMRYGFTSGVTFHDETGNGYTGTATNSPVPSFPGVDFTAASSMYIDIGACYNGVKTISMWVKPDAVNVTDEPIDLNGTDYLTIVNGTLTKNGFAAGTQVLYTNGIAAATTVTVNWTHIGITDTTGRNASDCDIARVTAAYHDGLAGDVRLYDRVLSANEMLSIYYQTRGYYSA